MVVRGTDGRDPRVPQHLPPPRQQARVDRLPPRGVERQLPAVRVQVPRLEVRARRRVQLRAAGERVLRPRQGRLRARSRPLRRVVGVHLRASRRAEPVADRVSRADGHGARRLSVRPTDRALLVPRGRREQLEALHGRLPGVLPRTDPAREAVAGRRATRSAGDGLPGPALPNRRAASARDVARREGLADAARSTEADGDADAQRPVRSLGRARSRRRSASRRQPRQREALGARLVPALAELRDPDLGARVVPHVPLLADVPQHARVRRQLVLRPGEDRARTRRARDGGGDVQGVRRCRTATRSRRRRSCWSRAW